MLLWLFWWFCARLYLTSARRTQQPAPRGQHWDSPTLREIARLPRVSVRSNFRGPGSPEPSTPNSGAPEVHCPSDSVTKKRAYPIGADRQQEGRQPRPRVAPYQELVEQRKEASLRDLQFRRGFYIKR